MQEAATWTFLAIGIALVLIGIFRGGEHEYSGPKYGLASLEHERVRSESAIITYDTAIKRLGDFPAALDKLLQTDVDKLFAVYADQYKRSALARERAKGHV